VQVNVAIKYFRGEGTPFSSARALSWLKSAAKRGDVRAHFNMGMLYYTGSGVEKSVDAALAHFKQAAEGGDVDAMCELGAMFDRGEVEGVEGRATEAAAKEWYEKAAEKGSVKAAKKLEGWR